MVGLHDKKCSCVDIKRFALGETGPIYYRTCFLLNSKRILIHKTFQFGSIKQTGHFPGIF